MLLPVGDFARRAAKLCKQQMVPAAEEFNWKR